MINIRIFSNSTTANLIGWIGICVLMVTVAQSGSAETIDSLRTEHITDLRRNFNQPTEVALDRKGRIYVLDGANNQIKIFNAQWEYVRAIGRRGTKNGEFLNPVGMDIDERGRLLVADTGNKRVQIFDRTGKYLRKIDLAQRNARPVEVKARPDNDCIYVSDAHNHQVLVYNFDGTFKSSWGDMGDRAGQLRYPGMMAADGKKDLYVVDILNGRIQIFDHKGGNPGQIGKLGVLPGQLYRPKGIAIDGKSGIYISDSYTGIIQVFDRSGKLRGILTTGPGKTYLRLTTPLGMAIDAQNRLYVVESTLNKVSVFNLK